VSSTATEENTDTSDTSVGSGGDGAAGAGSSFVGVVVGVALLAIGVLSAVVIVAVRVKSARSTPQRDIAISVDPDHLPANMEWDDEMFFKLL
jgi:hypothetical protein